MTCANPQHNTTMSVLRDIRLLIAKHLDLPVTVRSSVIEVLNSLDVSLDTEGYEPPQEVLDALKKLDKAIIEDDPDPDEEYEEDDEYEDEYIGLDDIEYDEADEDEEEEEDD